MLGSVVFEATSKRFRIMLFGGQCLGGLRFYTWLRCDYVDFVYNRDRNCTRTLEAYVGSVMFEATSNRPRNSNCKCRTGDV